MTGPLRYAQHHDQAAELCLERRCADATAVMYVTTGSRGSSNVAHHL